MNNHQKLLNEARETREGMTPKEMLNFIFDRIWVVNKEVGTLTGKVDLLAKIVVVIFTAVLGLVFFVLQRSLGG